MPVDDASVPVSPAVPSAVPPSVWLLPALESPSVPFDPDESDESDVPLPASPDDLDVLDLSLKLLFS